VSNPCARRAHCGAASGAGAEKALSAGSLAPDTRRPGRAARGPACDRP